MKLFRRAAWIVDDAVLLQSGDAGCVKPDAHHERPEDEHDHWRENWTRQCQPPDRRCMGRLYPCLSNGRNGSHAVADPTRRASGFDPFRPHNRDRGRMCQVARTHTDPGAAGVGVSARNRMGIQRQRNMPAPPTRGGKGCGLIITRLPGRNVDWERAVKAAELNFVGSPRRSGYAKAVPAEAGTTAELLRT